MSGAIGFFSGAFRDGSYYLGEWFLVAALLVLLLLFFSIVGLLMGIWERIKK